MTKVPVKTGKYIGEGTSEYYSFIWAWGAIDEVSVLKIYNFHAFFKRQYRCVSVPNTKEGPKLSYSVTIRVASSWHSIYRKSSGGGKTMWRSC